eukprot:TRINITY_DN1668_c0_g1_i5.p1 TRINITY_DN1668_c0_g1~~TRINITY_DN1668_c0_g1_i5.p1  ORF type:complete len:188 (+),score=22.23 TRINITY_DN1668_c0_g1_i5:81-644(+)
MVKTQQNLMIVVILLVLMIIIPSQGRDGSMQDASRQGCESNSPIETRLSITECVCSNGKSCIWERNGKNNLGCPCSSMPTSTDYTCLKVVDVMNCAYNKVQCLNLNGQCQCDNGSICVWYNKTSIVGCPCPGGRLPTDADFVKPLPQQKKKPKKNKNKDKKNEDAENNTTELITNDTDVPDQPSTDL